MPLRRLLATLAIAIAFFVATEQGQARPATDVRYGDGVEIAEAQREGLQVIESMLHAMDALADRAILPTSTSAFRVVLNGRFQGLMERIRHVATTTETHGYFLLRVLSWVSVEAAPGSNESVTLHGLDATPPALELTAANILTESSAQAAITALSTGVLTVQSGLQHNCSDLAALQVDAGCGSVEPFCRSGVNSSGYVASLWGVGSLVVGGDELLTFRVQSCPSGSLGWFLMGRGTTNVPIGNGRLCIGGGAGGLFRLSSLDVICSSGQMSYSLNEADPRFTALIQPGSTWHFQFVFTDTSASAMNSSNGLRVVFEP